MPLLFMFLLDADLVRADCLPINQAGQHVGETRCVTGKVVRVEQGSRGVHYLDFCEDYRICPFTVVVFPQDLRSVGDIRQLQGRVVEIHGAVKEYDGRAQIILQEARQLRGETAQIPPLPKNYDVEQKGRFSAGKFSHPKTKRPKSKKRHPATLPIEIPGDSAGDDTSTPPITTLGCAYTIPLRNSSSEYFVPRHNTPPCHRVTVMERSVMYMNSVAPKGCKTK